MRIILFFCLAAFFIPTTYAQVVDKYKKIYTVSKQKDTIVELTYFKNVDSILASKIDSFICYQNQQLGSKAAEDYFFCISFWARPNGQYISVKHKAMYNDFLMLTGGTVYTRNESAFAYSFYKDKLVVFTTNNRSIHIGDCGISILKNLIFEQFSLKEKRKILQKPEIVEVSSQPVKGYYID